MTRFLIYSSVLMISFMITEIQSEMACYSCLHDGKYLCLNETYQLHLQTCPGIPKEYQNNTGIQEVCYKTYFKQRHKPKYLITRGCAVKTNTFDPCVDLRKVSVIGPKARCLLCDTPMCNEAALNFPISLNIIFGILMMIALNFS